MSFEFNQTCPSIDRGISNIKNILEDHLGDIVQELSPMFYGAGEGKYKNEWIEDAVKYLYDDIKGAFEDVRKTNEDMRSAADSQIDDLEEQLDRAIQETEELRAEVRELEEKVD